MWQFIQNPNKHWFNDLFDVFDLWFESILITPSWEEAVKIILHMWQRWLVLSGMYLILHHSYKLNFLYNIITCMCVPMIVLMHMIHKLILEDHFWHFKLNIYKKPKTIPPPLALYDTFNLEWASWTYKSWRHMCVFYGLCKLQYVIQAPTKCQIQS